MAFCAFFFSSRLVKRVAGEIYKVAICLNYLALFAISGLLLPYRFRILSNALALSWLNSLYCFEYTWASRQWSVDKTLGVIESHWAYFLGFGLPGTLLTLWFPHIISSGLYSLLFPFYVVAACYANPKPPITGLGPKFAWIPNSLPIFRLAKLLTSSTVRVCKFIND